MGGLIADFCVIDRVPFRPEYRGDAQLPPLQPDGTRWEYSGFELDQGKVYPLLEWNFYHNEHDDSRGGFARWGCIEETRAPHPSQPEWLFFRGNGRGILTTLSDGPPTLAEVCARAELPRAVVAEQLEQLSSFDPPAVIRDGEQFKLHVPILTRDDLAALLTKGDKVAESIHNQVTIPYQRARERAAAERGLRAVLPGVVLVREFAFQRLFEAGILPGPPVAPVAWNQGVWGWLGPLPMWGEVA